MLNFLRNLFGGQGEVSGEAPSEVPFSTMVRDWRTDDLRTAVTTYKADYPHDKLLAIAKELERREGPSKKTGPAENRTRRQVVPPAERSAQPPATSLNDDWLPLLRVQAFREEYLDTMLVSDAVVRRPLAPGLQEVLVLDGLGAESTLSREQAASAEEGEEALFERGRRQALESDYGGVTLESVGGIFDVAVSNSFFLSACMLELLRQGDFPAGVIVAPVSWHHWAMHQVVPGKTPRAILDELGRLVKRLESDIDVTHAEWLGTTVYWWRAGQPWEELPFEEDTDGALVARPSAELAAHLAESD